jgi:ABC-type Zn uptake system ZnuABC Zn-binding protein ZnuA
MFVAGEGRIWRPLLMVLILALSGLILIGCSAAPAAEPTSVAELHEEDHHDDDDDHVDGDHDDEHGHEDDEDHGHDHDEEHAHDNDHAHDDDDDHAHDHDQDHHGEHELSLPELSPIALAAGEKLRVVATTSIIGDVVAQVGGEAIELTVLMGAGQDPHSYAPSAAQLTAVARAHVIFVNGWDLEERLLRDLENIAEGLAPLIPVSAYVEPLEYGADGHLHHDDDHAHEDDDDHAHEDDHDHGPIDPHTWFDVRSVVQWVDNILHALEDLDPANEELYEANAEAYIAELRALDEYIRDQVRPIPQENRKLVTSHDSLGYFGRAYGFEIIGTLIPGLSTMAEPSASDLAALIREMREEGVCAIFVETIASDRLGQVVAGELTGCANVQVATLYTGALDEPGSGADSYIGMMRANVDTIVSALK